MKCGESKKNARRRRIGLAILASTADGTAMLKEYLRAELVSEPEERIENEGEEIVQEFLQMDPDAVVTLTEPTDAESRSDLQVALDFAVKWDLREWTSLQNRSKGVAPSVAILLERKRKLSSDLHASVGMAPTKETGRRARYKWLQAWRQRWKMPKGSFKHQDMPSVVDMRRKVGLDRTPPESRRHGFPQF